MVTSSAAQACQAADGTFRSFESAREGGLVDKGGIRA